MSAGEALGITGAGIVTLSAIYYIVDILRGGTRPQRTSWGVWAVVGVLGFGSADTGGAGPGAYAAGVDAVACVITFLISLDRRYGKPGGLRLDPLLGVLAVVGVILWRWGPLTDTGAAICAVACELLALWPTLREAWRRPETESLLSWSADLVGHVLCLAAVAEISVAALAYPVYLVAATAAVVTLLVARRRAPATVLDELGPETGSGPPPQFGPVILGDAAIESVATVFGAATHPLRSRVPDSHPE